MKTKLIVNPVSGTNDAANHLVSINERLRQHGDTLDIVMTVAEGDATRMAADAARAGDDRLIVAGGDGRSTTSSTASASSRTASRG